jgi:hypothetical protein
VFLALGPLSLARKQRSGSPLHEYTGGGGHPTMQLHGKGEGTGGPSSFQMSVHGRQEGKDERGLHGGQTKRSALLVYAWYIGREGS